MSIDVDVSRRLGSFNLEAGFRSQGGLTALFGPSGSGKTSLVNILGGLLRPDQGRVVVDDTVFVDTAKRLYTPAHKRRIGYVFQDARLFPHLTVEQNLNYGRWFTPAKARYADTARIVEMLGIGGLLQRRPAALSGGEKQRVAIGRSLASSPRLLLMDEPLASLDEARKAEIMPYIERLRDELHIPIVYVSHSIAEVARLADQVVLLDQGKVVASGPTTEIMLRTDLLPRQEQAEAGALLELAVAGHDTAYAMTVLHSSAGEIRVPQIDLAVGSPVRLRVRARDVMLALKRPEEISGLNVLEGRVSALADAGSGQVDVTLDCGGQSLVARITRLSADRLALKAGMGLFAIVKSVSFEGSRGASVAPRSH